MAVTTRLARIYKILDMMEFVQNSYQIQADKTIDYEQGEYLRGVSHGYMLAIDYLRRTIAVEKKSKVDKPS